jgi:tetratricopeptide (TPR) repeat protein
MCIPLLAVGEFARVKEHVEAADRKPILTWGTAFDDAEQHFMLVDMAVQQRDEDALRQYAPLAEETAVRDGHRLFQAAAHRAWGVLYRLQGEYAAAETRLNQALALFQDLDTRWQIGRTLYESAELARAQSDPTQARVYFARALKAFEEMGAKPDMARTRAALASLD